MSRLSEPPERAARANMRQGGRLDALARFAHRQSGQDVVEYGTIIETSSSYCWRLPPSGLKFGRGSRRWLGELRLSERETLCDERGRPRPRSSGGTAVGQSPSSRNQRRDQTDDVPGGRPDEACNKHDQDQRAHSNTVVTEQLANGHEELFDPGPFLR